VCRHSSRPDTARADSGLCRSLSRLVQPAILLYFFINLTCFFVFLYSSSLGMHCALYRRLLLSLLAESIEWFIDDQAFLLAYDSAPRPPPPSPPPLPSASCLSFSVYLCVAEERGAGWVRARIQITQPQESRVLYISFNTLWLLVKRESPQGAEPNKIRTSCKDLLLRLAASANNLITHHLHFFIYNSELWKTWKGLQEFKSYIRQSR
jgi:hypothetical protein